MNRPIINTRLLTISQISTKIVCVKIERWNNSNHYHPTNASLGRIMQLVTNKYPVIRFEYDFPKSIKTQNRQNILVGGHWHGIDF
jgi:hypothetical protein